MSLTMREARQQWVEFMTTFEGRAKTRDFEDQFDAMLDAHNREVAALALGRAKMTLPLEDLASSFFVASDGVGSVAVSTNEEAKNQVLRGLDAMIREYRMGKS